jgi:hypothetical protein
VLDGSISAEPQDRPAGAHERLLGEFLGGVAIAHDPEEVGEDGPLVGSEDIFHLQGSISLLEKCGKQRGRHRRGEISFHLSGIGADEPALHADEDTCASRSIGR